MNLVETLDQGDVSIYRLVVTLLGSLLLGLSLYLLWLSLLYRSYLWVCL